MIEPLLALYSPTTLGVIFVLVWAATSVIVTIPAFATRGTPQVVWFRGGGLHPDGGGGSACRPGGAQQPG